MNGRNTVLIVGGGPTGLMLAGELALCGVDVAIVERRASQELEGSRRGGLHPRSLEVLDQRGIADRFVSNGKKYPVTMFPGVALDTTDLPSRFNYWLAIWQAEVERILVDWIGEMQVPIHRSCVVTDFAQGDDGVNVEVEDGRTFRARYLVGCDGGRSVVRKKAGIEFLGSDPDISYIIFEADMAQEPKAGLNHGPRGTYALGRIDGGERVRGVLTEQRLMRGDSPSLDELRTELIASFGTDYAVHNVTWLSRFTDAARQASTYRRGRVLLAGDAAHIHSPVGGQGLNLGLLDAVNLGWKLAQVVKGMSPESLLDTYEAERHPVAARVLQTTMAMTALNRGDVRTNALRGMMAGVMRMDEPRRWYAAKMSGLDIQYDIGQGHPLLGRRIPDLDLMVGVEPVRVFSMLHACGPILLNLGEPGAFSEMQSVDRIRLVDAKYDGGWELPGVGAVPAPSAVLIRPDGYVAWVGDGTKTGLSDALTHWFGLQTIRTETDRPSDVPRRLKPPAAS